MTLSLDRQNDYRARYQQAHPGWAPATAVYDRLIRDAIRPDFAVLDIGCGRGGVLEQLGAAVACPFGIDPDLQSLIEYRVPLLPRAAALADRLPFRDRAFDLILCSWVLEHVAAPEIVFAEVARALKPGGSFMILTPNRAAFVTTLNRVLKPIQHYLVPRLYGRAESDTFPVLYRANTRVALAAYAAGAGLTVQTFIEVPDPTYLAFNPVLYAISRAISRVTPSVHLVGAFQRP